LQALGIQDIHLTKNPEINIFKYNYYRYVNFATDVLKLQLNDTATFNKKTTCDIPKRGHLLSKLYLHLKLPQLQKNNGTYISWTDALGYSIFSDPIELEIGGVVVDKLYPQFLNIWNDLSKTNNDFGKNLMILKSDVYSSGYYNASKDVDLIIPLEFWFTKQYSSALPLLSMYNQDIRVNFKLKDFSQCINYDGNEPSSRSIISSQVLAEYIFLDDVILKQFQNQKHTYIIEQIQYHGDEIIPQNYTAYNTTLKFNNPCKELIFCCAEKQNVDNNNYFVYSKTSDGGSLITEASLLLDGKLRFDALPEFYYRSIFPDCVHNTIPLKYIYTMPFSLKPEDNQPTGSLNMSRFNDVVLSLRLPPGNVDCMLYVFALSYNILTIENGTFTLEWLTQ
jgi:hypothetical protein